MVIKEILPIKEIEINKYLFLFGLLIANILPGRLFSTLITIRISIEQTDPCENYNTNPHPINEHDPKKIIAIQ